MSSAHRINASISGVFICSGTMLESIASSCGSDRPSLGQNSVSKIHYTLCQVFLEYDFPAS